MTRMTWRFRRSSGSVEKAERRQGVGRSRRAPTQTSLDGRPGLPSTVAPRLASKKRTRTWGTRLSLRHQLREGLILAQADVIPMAVCLRPRFALLLG